MGKEEIQVILYGKLVNVSNWASSHPGGVQVMKTFNNRDATEQFEAMHSREAKLQLANVFLPKSPVAVAPSASASQPPKVSFEVSDSDTFVCPSDSSEGEARIVSSYAEGNHISRDFAVLRKTLEEKGFFKTNILKEFMLTFYTLFMYSLGGYLIFVTPYSYWGLFFLLLGLHMSGWVAHDYLHHSIFPSVYWNDFVGEFFGMLQGYDTTWWKLRHNQHHVTTNECSHDPDIAIAPLFHFVQQYPDIKSRLAEWQKYQHYYFLPFLSLLDLDWRYESIVRVVEVFHKGKLPAIKLSLHYTVAAAIIMVVGLWPCITLTLARGFLTAIIVFSSHYAEKRYFGVTPSLVEQTAFTTRNISGGFWINFLSGQISLQIEHHLFPTMPPHNLFLARPYVKRFFQEHQLMYNENTLYECVSRLLSSLNTHASLK